MSATVKALIASELALVEQVVEQEAADAQYGRDLSCIFDSTSDLAEVAGSDPTALVQRCARRLITEQGTLDEDPEYGYNLVGLLNRGVTDAETALIETRAEAECLKEDGVDAADVTVTLSGYSTYTAEIVLTPADPSANPLQFAFAVTAGTNIVELLT